MRRTPVLGLLALLALPAAGRPVAAAEPDELLKYVPAPVNTVAVINVAAILSSPRAVKEGWSKIDHTEYLAGAVPVHPSVERMLLATEMNPDAPGRGGVLAVIPTNAAVDLEKFAKSRGGHVDTVGGESVAVTGNTGVGVKLGDKLLGLARTDSRQEVARWVRYAKTATVSQQGKYINAAVHNAGTKHHILIAIETEDLFHPGQIGLVVAQSEVLGQDKPTADAIQAFLAKLTGVRFTADVLADGIAAEVRIDSTAPAAKVNPEFFKAFAIELLNRNGATLEDLPAAAAKADGNAVTLSFRISDPELARVMALVAAPVQGVAADDTIAVAPQGVNPEKTRKYYATVNKILDELKAQNKKAKDYEKTAVWHDTAANKIETMSILGVDPLVIEYGVGTAGRLRAISDSLRGVPVQAAALQSEAYVFGFMPRTTVWGGRGGGFRLNPWMAAGPQSVQTNLPEIRKKQADLIKNDAENRGKLLDQIEKQRSDVRRAVAQKSAIDLDTPKK